MAEEPVELTTEVLGEPGTEPGAEGEAGGEGAGEEGAELSEFTILDQSVTFFILALAIGVSVDLFNQKVLPAKFRPPLAVILLVTGFVLSAIGVGSAPASLYYSTFKAITTNLDPEIITVVFLPPILFESSSTIDFFIFRRITISALWIAFPAAIVGILITLGFVQAILGGVAGWTLAASALLASILSATDPVAVIAVLHQVGAPKKLATLVEGSSLFNDGTAFVGFTIFLAAILGELNGGGDGVRIFFGAIVGGILWGVTLGIGLYFFFKFLHNDGFAELTLILVAMYAAFFVGEVVFEVSGVLAVVGLGLTFSAVTKYAISPETEEAKHAVLNQLAYWANILLFTLAGAVLFATIAAQTPGIPAVANNGLAWGALFAIYFILHVVRFVIFFLSYPVLAKTGFGISWKELALIIFGGIRGAISLSLGLLVVEEIELAMLEAEAENNEEEIARLAPLANVGALINFIVSGVVLISLIINGGLSETVYNFLDPFPANPARTSLFDLVMEDVEEEVIKEGLDHIHHDPLFRSAPWKFVEQLVPNMRALKLEKGRVNRHGIPHFSAQALFQTYFQKKATPDGYQFRESLSSKLTPEGTDDGLSTSAALKAMGSGMGHKGMDHDHEGHDHAGHDESHKMPARKTFLQGLRQSQIKRESVFAQRKTTMKKDFGALPIVEEGDASLQAIPEGFDEEGAGRKSMALSLAISKQVEDFSPELKMQEIRIAMFKRIRGAYLHQFENREISTIATARLDLAAARGADIAVKEDVAVAWEAEFDDLLKFTITIPPFWLRLVQIPVIGFMFYPLVFGRVMSAIEAAVGYHRAHHEVLSAFKETFPETDWHHLEDIILAAMNSLHVLAKRFPDVYLIAQSLYTARFIIWAKRKALLEKQEEGLLEETDLHGVLHVLDEYLQGIERAKQSYRLGVWSLQNINNATDQELLRQ